MFDIGKSYWFVFKGDKQDRVTIKGEVIEENGFMVKVKRDSGLDSFISLNSILNVNEVKPDE